MLTTLYIRIVEWNHEIFSVAGIIVRGQQQGQEHQQWQRVQCCRWSYPQDPATIQQHQEQLSSGSASQETSARQQPEETSDTSSSGRCDVSSAASSSVSPADQASDSGDPVHSGGGHSSALWPALSPVSCHYSVSTSPASSSSSSSVSRLSSSTTSSIWFLRLWLWPPGASSGSGLRWTCSTAGAEREVKYFCRGSWNIFLDLYFLLFTQFTLL